MNTSYSLDMAVASSVTARIMETWAHGQDLADALGVRKPLTGRLRHLHDPVLDSAARLAARSEDAEAWRFVRRKSAGHIDALCAATIAVHLADAPAPPRPSVA